MSSRQKIDLKIDWCSYQAAKWAVEHWHYSGRMPKSKLARLGVWEDAVFIGAVIFGAPANNNLGRPYGLKQVEVCELVRVALRQHISPVTQIMAMGLKVLRVAQPGLRLIVSFADPEQGHLGVIYQAGNWLYAGTSIAADEYVVLGKRWHGRALRHRKPATMTTRQYARMLDPGACFVKGSSKHRYLYPLDRAMRRQIAPLAQPYPKRADS